MTENIAEKIREERGPTGEMADLAAQVQRLRMSLEVARKWQETADNEGSDTLGAHAEYMRDTIEEEYSRACFEMEVLERRRIFYLMAD
jgi:hypothetical protein